MEARELAAEVMPNGSVQLEWTHTQEKTGKSTALLEKEILERYLADRDSWLLFLCFCDRRVSLSPSLAFWRDFARLFGRKLTLTPELERVRHKVKIPTGRQELSEQLLRAPPMTGSEYLSLELLETLWRRLNEYFSKSIKSHEGTVAEFVGTYSPNVHLVGRVFFHLVENKDHTQPFAFLATYSTGLSNQGRSKHLPLKYALQEYAKKSKPLLELLVAVHLAAKQSRLVSELLETGELFHPLAWSAAEAFHFLKEIPIYEESGILCRIPDWWKGAKAGPKLNILVGDQEPGPVNMNAFLQFDARLFLGDMEITEEEARRLLEQSEGLAFLKNRWVAADPDKLKKALEAFETAKKMTDGEGLSLRDALRLQLNPKMLSPAQEEGIEATVSNGKWLESVIQRLRNPERLGAVDPGRTFKAELREYQKDGLNWLHFLHSLGFGACLADDMGLGKTVQVLGFLNVLKSKKAGAASLLIIPASLIGNWMNEIKRFAPHIRTFVAHPDAQQERMVAEKKKDALDALDLVITTYTLVQKYAWLQSYCWQYIILDEAQAIKNPGTKQTRTVKKLQAKNRIIMTGTPVENRLGDLWSLFDFVNPGLLGNVREFTDFSRKLKQDAEGYVRLRKLVSPYILRRLKTDKSVISDLPDKVEMKIYASLSKRQVLLYQKTVSEIRRFIENKEGIQRKGVILSSLMKFKQLCNHPDQYLGTGEYAEKDSGKFARLREICETIHEKRERVLVFTQFKEITGPLCSFLESLFGRKGLVLHGSVPVGKRKKLIEQFQSSDYVPFMVLSLKAGGIGLNLTEANHVIHFDRWWNPAVENQATDRAFRIGQKRNVIVHKFITKGTIEEKIDKMIEEKADLFEKVISSSGERWITEMNNEQLIDLFRMTL